MRYLCLLFIVFSGCTNTTAQTKFEKSKNKKQLVKAVNEMHNHFKIACMQESFLMEGDLVKILNSLNIKNMNIALIGADKDNCQAKVKINARWKNGTEPYKSPLIVTLPLDNQARERLGL